VADTPSRRDLKFRTKTFPSKSQSASQNKKGRSRKERPFYSFSLA
jgi:hypothetical protein